MRFVSLLLVTTLACGGSRTSPAGSPAVPAKPAATAGSSADGLPIAQYLGHDEATGRRVFDLLRAAGIEASSGGSLGYSVWVSSADRAKARQILQGAAASECLAVSIYDDQGQPIEGTQPARCAPTPTSAPVDSSKK